MYLFNKHRHEQKMLNNSLLPISEIISVIPGLITNYFILNDILLIGIGFRKYSNRTRTEMIITIQDEYFLF